MEWLDSGPTVTDKVAGKNQAPPTDEAQALILPITLIPTPKLDD